MSFDDLPDNWPDLPVTGEILDDVLDLVVTERNRHDGCLHVLLCDRGDRLIQPCVIEDLPGIPPDLDADRTQVFAPFVRALEEIDPEGGVITVISRADGLSISADDRRWQQAAIDACAGRVRALGVHVVTLHGSRRVPAARTAA